MYTSLYATNVIRGGVYERHTRVCIRVVQTVCGSTGLYICIELYERFVGVSNVFLIIYIYFINFFFVSKN